MNDIVDPQPPSILRRRRRAVPDEDDLDYRDVAEVENTANINRRGLVDDPRIVWPPPDDFDLDLAEARRARSIIQPREPVRPVRPIRPVRPPQRRQRRPPSDTPNNFNMSNGRISQLYCFLSTLLAVLAVIVAPSKTYPVDLETPPSLTSYAPSISSWSSVEQVAKAAAVGLAARKGEKPDIDTNDLLQSIHQWWNTQQQEQHQHQQHKQKVGTQPTNSPASPMTMPSPFWWWRHNRQKDISTKTHGHMETTLANDGLKSALMETFWNWIDPAVLWNPTARTPTDIIEKILTSTPRLLAIANFMLAMTYLFHSAIASWFLGDHSVVSSSMPGTSPNVGPPSSVDWSSPTRERMGGFLVFKLLLISAVVAPDTLDLLILLTWYTTLSCLRSLDHLAHATTTHHSALGQAPKAGVLKLLILVLMGDILAAASCVALFHSAGLGMVLLLTCDCALLASDVLSHIIKHFTCVLEELHSQTIQSLEARQIQLHSEMNNNSSNDGGFTSARSSSEQRAGSDEHNSNNEDVLDPLENLDTIDDEPDAYQRRRSSSPDEESRRLDQRMEVLELAHSRRLAIMDNAMFALDLVCHALTVAHFCHIWSLHGVQFTLIDGVLALHLHAAISSSCKKIAQRRNVHSIARDLHGLFPNASDQELRKASLAGDVCCICLGTMSTGGHVKKVPCGHLYHTHCLREVVERAQSVQAAKCPLCRSCLIDGQGQNQRTNSGTPAAVAVPTAVPPSPAAPAPPVVMAPEANPPPPQQQQAGADHALFRFSTEGIMPAWIPIPAFSFEVVRRPSTAAHLGAAPVPLPVIGQQLPAQQLPTQVDGNGEDRGQQPIAAAWGVDNPAPWRPQNVPIPQPDQQEEDTPSFLRRFLILAGAVPMSPLEEARALAHLVDMFPQYERSHLLRELRERGSPEAVAEAILMGVFSSGVPRGE